MQLLLLLLFARSFDCSAWAAAATCQLAPLAARRGTASGRPVSAIMSCPAICLGCHSARFQCTVHRPGTAPACCTAIACATQQHMVPVQVRTKDQYQRNVSSCTVETPKGAVDIGAYMVSTGHAVAYRWGFVAVA